MRQIVCGRYYPASSSYMTQHMSERGYFCTQLWYQIHLSSWQYVTYADSLTKSWMCNQSTVLSDQTVRRPLRCVTQVHSRLGPLRRIFFSKCSLISSCNWCRKQDPTQSGWHWSTQKVMPRLTRYWSRGPSWRTWVSAPHENFIMKCDPSGKKVLVYFIRNLILAYFFKRCCITSS